MTRNHITKLEDLSNEIFLEIFEYLIAEDLFTAFGNLQKRMNELLKNPSLLTRLATKKLSFIQSLCDVNQIRFVTIQGTQTATLSADLRACSPMSNASQLFLYGTFVPDLMLGLPFIKTLMPNLVHISIEASNPSSSSASNNVNFIIERLLALIHLRTLTLKFDFYTKNLILVRLSNIRRCSFLEHFSLVGCSLSLLSVIDLMTNAPQLTSLKVQIRRGNEFPDYSIFKQLNRGILQLTGFDDFNLRKILGSLINVVHLGLDDDTLTSITRLSITQPTCLTRLPIRCFDPW